MTRRPFALLFAALLAAGCTMSVDDGRVDVRFGDPDAARDGRPDASGPAPVDGRNVTVHFIDVGQGDAILVVTPNGRTLLMDAGHRGSGDDVIAYLERAGVTRLDAFVASHGDADHIGGAGVEEDNVLEAFPPTRVYEPGYPKTTLTYETFLRTVDAVDADYFDHRDFAPGDVLDIDNNVTITFLHPARVNDHGEPNDEGIVLRLAYGSFSVMLPGDAGAPVEDAILARDLAVASTVLKVGHHGSRSSTTAAWLGAVDPELAVVSVGGANPYGHPHEEVLERLDTAGATVYRTDVDGSVRVTSDGVTWSVSTHD